jgi:hypothetical protein
VRHRDPPPDREHDRESTAGDSYCFTVVGTNHRGDCPRPNMRAWRGGTNAPSGLTCAASTGISVFEREGMNSEIHAYQDPRHVR